MSNSLKERTISGMIWSSVHRFGTMGISFITNLVLARLLTPEDFGIIGMIMVFIAVSGTLVDGGFASALIQKKKPTNDDYSTIFYWNLFASIILFFVLFICAPAIESFYQMESLSLILRVLGCVLILNAFNIIQFNQLTKTLNFRKLANTHIISTSIGAVTGISMAYMGFGVWSLVAKMIAISFFNSILLWFSSSWRPGFIFKFEAFKSLFSYGSYMLLTSILIAVYDNIKSLIIGKVFSAGDLGYYVQAHRMERIPIQGLSSVVNQVTFPVFSGLQDDIEKLVKGVRTSLRAITYINFPAMILLMVIAKPLILFLFTEKWAESIPYLQILCFGGMVYTLNTVNNNILKSLGRSDIYFYVLLAKRLVGLVLIIFGLKYGLKGMLYGVVAGSYISFLIAMHYSSKLCGYKISQQLRDVGPSYLLSIVIGLLAYLIGVQLTTGLFLHIFIISVFYIGSYILSSYVLKLEELAMFSSIIKSKFTKQ